MTGMSHFAEELLELLGVFIMCLIYLMCPDFFAGMSNVAVDLLELTFTYLKAVNLLDLTPPDMRPLGVCVLFPFYFVIFCIRIIIVTFLYMYDQHVSPRRKVRALRVRSLCVL
ncbi:hypothetical protein T492DRAFT_1017521 [Pavlovales sp. CCMP2436]|nr:hypothetical protein T492DRAFT_1017521 [Pavlovales sp. CCMP2436]